ncbi:FAD-dependent oxidoreductase, partial [Bacillus cereus]
MRKKVVIIGGGITGLTTMYHLQKDIRDKNLPIDTLLIEASGKLGGKIQTVRKDGFTIERGPDSFLARKESAARLVKELAKRRTKNAKAFHDKCVKTRNLVCSLKVKQSLPSKIERSI